MMNRTLLLIDGPNLFATAKLLGFEIDFKKLLQEFQSPGGWVMAKYYTAVPDDEDSPVVPLIDWLDYNGYAVVTKPTKTFVDADGNRKIKGNMDVEIAVDAMEFAEKVGEVILFSGDGDFRAVIEALQRRGVKVTVVSSIVTRPPMCADELRRQTDVFVDLTDLRMKISRGARTPRDASQLPLMRAGDRRSEM
jgi:uncharacterized LabA/DUF88 family protein